MGNLCSATSAGPSHPSRNRVSQQPPSRGQALGPQQDLSQSVSPQGRNATHGPTPPGGSVPAPIPSHSGGKASQSLSTKPSRSRSMSSPHYPSKSNTRHQSYDSARMAPLPVSSGETSQKPLLKSGRTRIMSSPHNVSGRGQSKAAMRGNNTRTFPSTVREVLPDGFSQSGKSSLINTVFNVDMAAAPGSQHDNADINVGCSPANNRYLVVHEYSGFESGDAQSLQTTRDFIAYRTDADRSASERLHAIWICVPISDAIEKGLGNGVKEILGMKKVPTLIVFTKFDLLVSRVQFDVTRGEQPSAKARATYEGLCSSLFHKDSKDVPAVIFSEKPAFRDLISELTSTTHTIIKVDSQDLTGRPTSSSQVLPSPPITPTLLAWSIAQRVNHDVIIQASIEHYHPTCSLAYVGYWRSLGTSQDFNDQALASCVNVIHDDIINVWNFDDKEGYLLSRDFMARMSHLVGDLAGPSAISPDLNGIVVTMAQWMNGPYQNKNNRNIRCIMAYIVDLTVILYGLFSSARSVSGTEVQSAVKDFAKSSVRSQIHDHIRSFITQIPFTYQNKDTIMEVIIDLIKQNCVRTSSSS
ncbi:hypothetical protein EDB92DRAFT_1902620 [Lactarius akahatsu]|uniref:G domain-containing protein n=1 Tax=Lactarius akahatsu TaxID=416441 RepID=A0AAD4Q812_9AGAM|nr:hypothetical protein EDB92DRAFT_1902620 [Lactarius akahatsu]